MYYWEFLPEHLRYYVSPQDGVTYHAVDHAVWRYIVHQLYSFLKDHAHPAYTEGIHQTGITLDRIPSIEEIDRHLQNFGWRAVPVSGFIPPKVFMEMQALGVLPIAREMRTIEHLGYTPAPDIVHEAAGHAPMLVDPDYRAYIQEYAQLARKAIVSRWDMELYKAIRFLSDVKENPASSPDEVAQAEERFLAAYQNARLPSEGAWLARMNWWTAEYGLVGNLDNFRIYGAGLLSSVNESRHAFSSEVVKLPLTLDCIHVPYDITRMQPQLYVTPHFEWLRELLKQLESQMSFRLGGLVGLTRGLMAQTPVTVEWDTGLQVSGVIHHFLWDEAGQSVFFVKFQGPCQVGWRGKLLSDHDVNRHPEGFSLPCGLPDGYSHVKELAQKVESFQNRFCEFHWKRFGLKLSGLWRQTWVNADGEPVGACLESAILSWKDKRLFQPEWGDFDWFWGQKVVSVSGEVLNPRTMPNDWGEYVVRVQKPMSEKAYRLEPYFQKVQHLMNQGMRLSEDEKKALNDQVASLMTGEEMAVWKFHLDRV